MHGNSFNKQNKIERSGSIEDASLDKTPEFPDLPKREVNKDKPISDRETKEGDFDLGSAGEGRNKEGDKYSKKEVGVDTKKLVYEYTRRNKGFAEEQVGYLTDQIELVLRGHKKYSEIEREISDKNNSAILDAFHDVFSQIIDEYPKVKELIN